MSELDEYLKFAKNLAAEAGQIMNRYFLAKDIGSVWKDDDTPLTIADTMINNLVIDKVKASFPTHGVLGEEASYKPERQLIWVVDPIDGTIPYSLGIPTSTFSLALVDRKDRQPLVAAVLDFKLNRLYYAAAGSKAYLNEMKLKTTNINKLRKSYVSVLGFRDKNLGSCIDILHAKGAICMSLPSQVYSASFVASGKMVGSIFAYGSPWDSAAMALIVQQAGGIVTDLKGKERRYDEFGNGGILSANPEIHKKLVKVVKDAHLGD